MPFERVGSRSEDRPISPACAWIRQQPGKNSGRPAVFPIHRQRTWFGQTPRTTSAGRPWGLRPCVVAGVDCFQFQETGQFEWERYLPIKELPHIFNPPQGFFATANQNNIPRGYPHQIGFMWSDPFRFSRIQEVLGSGRKFTLTDMMELQYDFLSIPARTIVPLLKNLTSKDKKSEKARQLLLDWDCVMRIDGVEPTIYQSWETRLVENVWALYLPEKARELFPNRADQKNDRIPDSSGRSLWSKTRQRTGMPCS